MIVDTSVEADLKAVFIFVSFVPCIFLGLSCQF